MKKIEDIEKLGLEELENISLDKNIQTPKLLRTKIAVRIIAAGRRVESGFVYAFCAAGMAIILTLAILTTIPQSPEDTFNDPAQARAELEKTFAYISSKIDKGLDIVEKNVTTMEKPAQIISDINKY